MSPDVGSGRPLPDGQHHPKGGRGDVAGNPVGAVDARDHDRPQLGVGQCLDLGREAIDRPVVADPSLVVEPRDRKAKPETGGSPALPSWGSIID